MKYLVQFAVEIEGKDTCESRNFIVDAPTAWKAIENAGDFSAQRGEFSTGDLIAIEFDSIEVIE